MTPATNRIVDALIDGNDFKEQSLAVLLTYIAHLQATKGATFSEIHSVLSIAYSDLLQGEKDTLSTHFVGDSQVQQAQG